MSEHPEFTNLILEKYVTGDLHGQKRTDLETSLKTDQALQQRLANLEKHNASFRANPAYADMLQTIKTARSRQPGAMLRSLVHLPKLQTHAWTYQLAAVLVLSVALVILLLPFDAGDGGTRTKGSTPELEVYLVKNQRQAKLFNNSSIQAGDLLQLRFLSSAYHYGVVLSIDSTGQSFIHYPERIDQSTQIKKEQTINIGHSYEIAAKSSYEDFVLILSNHKLSAGDIVKTAKRAGNTARLRDALAVNDSDLVFETITINVVK